MVQVELWHILRNNKFTSERVSTLNRSISAACPLTMASDAPKTGFGSYGSLKN